MKRKTPPSPLLVVLALIGGIAAVSVIGLLLMHELELGQGAKWVPPRRAESFALIVGIGALAAAVLLRQYFW